jgi:hypothetical protein
MFASWLRSEISIGCVFILLIKRDLKVKPIENSSDLKTVVFVVASLPTFPQTFKPTKK